MIIVSLSLRHADSSVWLWNLLTCYIIIRPYIKMNTQLYMSCCSCHYYHHYLMCIFWNCTLC